MATVRDGRFRADVAARDVLPEPVRAPVDLATEPVVAAGNLAPGIAPVQAPEVASTDEMLAQMDRILTERGYLQAGDSVVFLAGQPVGRPGTTNLMKLHRIGDA